MVLNYLRATISIFDTHIDVFGGFFNPGFLVLNSDFLTFWSKCDWWIGSDEFGHSQLRIKIDGKTRQQRWVSLFNSWRATMSIFWCLHCCFWWFLLIRFFDLKFRFFDFLEQMWLMNWFRRIRPLSTSNSNSRQNRLQTLIFGFELLKSYHFYFEYSHCCFWWFF